MQTFLVGGAVRDRLLNRPSNDNDYVVVGSTVDEMLRLGFTQVGDHFPVFLHPKTGEEYALARTERKVAPGHTGFEVLFDPSVTLDEDLSRRDFTINAMAYEESTNTLFDPFGGQQDLEAKVIRHVGDAFGDDPLRVLRALRFASRFEFQIHHTTSALIKQVAPSLVELSPQRVVNELILGALQAAAPHHYVELLSRYNVHRYMPPELRGFLIPTVGKLLVQQHSNPLWVLAQVIDPERVKYSAVPRNLASIVKQVWAIARWDRRDPYDTVDVVTHLGLHKHAHLVDSDAAQFAIAADKRALLGYGTICRDIEIPRSPDIGAAIRALRVERVSDVMQRIGVLEA